jgi:hypothetical protein
MKSPDRRRPLLAVALACLVLAFAGSVPAQTGSVMKDPTEVLKKYLSLDAHGARLQPLSWESQKPYITWTEEPAWGRVVVISGYTVPMDVKDWEVRANLDVVIPVDFDVVGHLYWESATFLSEPKVERVSFHIKAVHGLWRIIEPMMPPHVDQKRMINFVRQSLLTETDVAKLDRLAALRDDLRKAR